MAALGLRLGGLDIITPDPGQPLDAVGGAVVDANAMPGFYYHYYKKDDRSPIALHIIHRVLDRF
jgi:hypothetical protein